MFKIIFLKDNIKTVTKSLKKKKIAKKGCLVK